MRPLSLFKKPRPWAWFFYWYDYCNFLFRFGAQFRPDL